jgi:hypothetical protein
MHEIAEYGIAAHALYKDTRIPVEMLSRESNAYAGFASTIELLAEARTRRNSSSTPSSSCSTTRCSASRPKGKLIALPRKATPIDFAYAVHTDVGNRAVGCKINGQMAPLGFRAQQRRRGRHHHLQGAGRRRPRPGNRSWSPAGRGWRSAAPPGPPSARNTRRSAGALSSG